jgi:hypothetical protein
MAGSVMRELTQCRETAELKTRKMLKVKRQRYWTANLTYPMIGMSIGLSSSSSSSSSSSIRHSMIYKSHRASSSSTITCNLLPPPEFMNAVSKGHSLSPRPVKCLRAPLHLYPLRLQRLWMKTGVLQCCNVNSDLGSSISSSISCHQPTTPSHPTPNPPPATSLLFLCIYLASPGAWRRCCRFVIRQRKNIACIKFAYTNH